jgi:hypothetical protein
MGMGNGEMGFRGTWKVIGGKTTIYMGMGNGEMGGMREK